MNLAVNFAPPRSRIVINEQHSAKHLNNLSLTHPFNFELSLLVDDALFTEQESQIQQLLSQQQSHFYICNASPLYLISILDSLNASQEQHHFYVHSVGSRTESANQIAIFPKHVSSHQRDSMAASSSSESSSSSSSEHSIQQHTIYLQVDKDTYEELGLEGSVVETYSHHNYHDRLYKSQYKIVIHWPQKSRAVAERVTWALQRLGNANVICSAYTKYQNVEDKLSDMIAPYKSIPLEPIFNQVNEKFASVKQQDLCTFKKVDGYGSDIRITKRIDVPQFVRETDQSSELVRQVLHTMGAISTGVSLEVLSPIVEMESSTEKEVRSVSFLTTSGFIAPHVVCNLVGLLHKQKHKHWSCLLVHGFEDAVISWRENAHSYGMSGENDYAIIFLSGEEMDHPSKVISCQILGQLDQV